MGCAAGRLRLPLVLAAAKCRYDLSGNSRLNADHHKIDNSVRRLTAREFMALVAMIHRQPSLRSSYNF